MITTGIEDLWWKAEKGQVHRAVFNYVRRIENENSDVFRRFAKLEQLYDPNTPDGTGDTGKVTENVIAAGVDTVFAMVATANIRARYMTDGADWGQARRARQLEFYSEELQTDLDINWKCQRGFKEATKKGMGLTKASTRFGKPVIECVPVENIIVDPAETRDGRRPMQFHQWDYVDADELIARFPKLEAEIEGRRGRSSDEWARVSGRYSLPFHMVVILYSFRLPIGVKGEPGYRPGRETITMDGLDVYDREYHEDYFPYGEMPWSERAKSWYPIGGEERMMGIQRALNKRNHTIEKSLDRGVYPVTYLRHQDVSAVSVTTEAGQFVPIKGEYPLTQTPPAVHPDVVNSRIHLRQSGLEELGVNQMAAHATKPGGIDSGVGIRELHNATTVRYAPQEQAFEQFVLDTIWLALMQCKKLGKKAPKMVRKGRFGARELAWKHVDPREARIQMRAASNTTRQPWGRAQTAMELAQGGLISTDSARRMLKHLDVDQELSLYMAALESIEGDLDDIADGFVVVPEPFGNAAMAVWRGQNEYLKWERESAPEDVLEVLRQYIEIAADLVDRATNPQNENMPAPMAAPGAMPGQPTAALAPEAMSLMAS